MAMIEVVRDFAPGTVKDIKRNHGVILNPLETSLARLVDVGRSFRYIVNRTDPRFMNLISGSTQIVFFPDPRQFYVPDSNRKNLAAQEALLAVDEAEVIRGKWGIGGLKLVIGDVATHAGLVFAYFDKTGGKVRLHGGDYGYRFARTETPTFGSSVAGVGDFRKFRGLNVVVWRRGGGDGLLWAVRLGVPAQE